nr:C-type lectin 8 [Tropidolaemus subannulatus]
MGRCIFVSFGLLVVFLSLSGTGADERCLPGWSLFDQSCYRVFRQRMRWANAEMSCRREAEGSHLASIQSLAESDFLARLVSIRARVYSVWIGLSYTRENGNWQWTDGSPFNYQFWNGKKPKNLLRRESCVFLRRFFGFLRWSYQPCWVPRYFVCKSQPQIEGSG